MNNYMIATWEYSPTFGIDIKENVLLSYTGVKENKYGDIILKGVRLVNPSALIDIENDCWNWKLDSQKINIEFCLADPCTIFEAPDDDSAKLIFEVADV